MAHTYAFTAAGTVMRDDGVEIPDSPGSQLYDEWQAWVGDGGTTTPATAASLDDLRAAGIVEVNHRAAEARATLTLSPVPEVMGNALRFREAQDYEADPSPDDADYPLLSSEVPGTGANVDAVHDAVLAELATLKAALAAIEVTREAAVADVEACGSQGAIDAVLAALDFS